MTRSEAVVVRKPDVLVGRPVLRGTRVPIEVLFENLADGMSLDEIVAEYESLDRADCIIAIMEACRLLAANASVVE